MPSNLIDRLEALETMRGHTDEAAFRRMLAREGLPPERVIGIVREAVAELEARDDADGETLRMLREGLAAMEVERDGLTVRVHHELSLR